MFDKDLFVKKYGEHLYKNKFLDFFWSEINLETIQCLKYLLTNCMIKSFEWEGNQYNVTKNRGEEDVIVWDELSLTHGVNPEAITFRIQKQDFLDLLLEQERAINSNKSKTNRSNNITI